MPNVHVTDVVIVGAGPVGIFGVFECGMLKMKCHVVDTLDAIGGQCTALYPEKPIYDIPGFPRVDAGELVQRLTDQAAPFEPIYHLGQTVTELRDLDDGTFAVMLSGGACLVAKAVIIAGGGGTLGPNTPPLPGIAGYEGRHVLYRVSRMEELRGRRVVVAGGGDSAVDWALTLEPIARQVTVIHRSKFRAHERSIQELEQSRAKLYYPFYEVREVRGDEHLEEVHFHHARNGETHRVPAQELIIAIGFSGRLGPLKEWGFQIERNMIVVDPLTMETGMPGVFGAGDIVTHPAKFKLIATGAAEAVIAVNHAVTYIDPKARLDAGHSTNIMEKKARAADE